MAVVRKHHGKSPVKTGAMRKRTDSPRRRKKCKCKNVQRVTRQRYDQTRRSCASWSPHSASKTEAANTPCFMPPKPLGSIDNLRQEAPGQDTHLVSLPLGGQVGQTAAGHRSELLPSASLIPPSVTKPGEEQARRHGADRARRGDSSRPVRQLTAGASSGRNQKKKKKPLMISCLKMFQRNEKDSSCKHHQTCCLWIA